MTLKPVIPLVLLLVSFLFGQSSAAASSQAFSEDAVRIIHLSPSGHEYGVAVDFSPDGRKIAVGTSSGIVFYESQTLKQEQFIETKTWARSVVFSPDGQSIAAGLFDGTARLWRISNGKLVQTFQAHSGWVRSVEFSPDGTTLITAADDDSVRVWNVSDGLLVKEVNHLTGVRAVALSPDGQTMAVGLQDSNIQLLNVSDGRIIKILIGHEGWVRCLAFSPDGSKLASGGFDTTARLWDLASGQLDYIFKGHQSSVLGLAFSPDGATLATGSVDTTVKLWNVHNGSLLRTLSGHTDFVYGVAFSPDGKLLVSTASDNTARVWGLSTQATNPIPQLPTSTDCRVCHHPHGINQPPRVIQMSCKACHADGIGMNWCAFVPRSPQAVSDISYSPPSQPVGIPVSSGNIAVQINYPTNGETLYVDPRNLAPVFVRGRVFFSGDYDDILVRMEIWSGKQSTKVLVTHPAQDGTFTFNLAINPLGDSIVAGAKAADPDCATCHEDFKSQAFLPNGQVHFAITAISPEGNQASDERWMTVDTGGSTNVDVRVVDKKSGAFVPGLPVNATTILYEWRNRYSNQISGADGLAKLTLGVLAQSATKYEISVHPSVLNGLFYKSIEPVTLELRPVVAIYAPVTIFVDSLAGRITGSLTGAKLTAPLDVWAVFLPDGTYHKTSLVNGEFTFENLPVGEYRVFLDPAGDRSGFHAAPVQVDLAKEPQVTIGIKLKKISALSLSGRVYDQDGKYLPFGWVTTASALTSKLNPGKGTYYLFGLEPTQVSVVANVPGYYSQAQAVDLSGGKNENLDFSLVIQPETKVLPWGNGKIILPLEAVYEENQGNIVLKSGWVWGTNEEKADLNLQAAGMQIDLTRGSFALEILSPRVGWLYLMEGDAVIHVDGHDVQVSGGQMVGLSEKGIPVPVPFGEAAVTVLNLEAESSLQSKWEPTLEAQIRDRLAFIGISIAQLVTFVTYMMVLIVIMALVIRSIYSIWKHKKKHRVD